MDALFGEVTRRLPDRWVVQSFAPGLLWCAVAAAGYALGQAGAFAFGAGSVRVEQLVRHTDSRPGGPLLAGTLLVLAISAVSVVAHLAAAGVRATWLGRWRGPAGVFGTRLTDRRRGRELARLNGRGERLPDVYLPSRPTWIGDRFQLVDVRVRGQYGLALALIWPRLWHLVDTDTRTLVQDARTRFDHATRLAGWALCYAVIAVVWWPAVLLAAGICCYAWYSGRSAAALFADTVETTVDLHHRRLVETLGYVVAPGEPLSGRIADAINDQLHKGGSPQPQRTASGGPTEEIV
ncbi:MAG TPA: hypothetical protein VH352_19825 [Pseudonocardiaceae bacterium]|nr:hypothetical protein [Pseudonocardiaceae bacterium]